MDASKIALKGSPSRDGFKSLHKLNLPSRCYAFDVDLAWCGRYGILAFFDFKRSGDGINKNERIGYKVLAGIAPFFILTGEESGPWTLERFEINGTLDMRRENVGWEDLAKIRVQLEKVEKINGSKYREIYLEGYARRTINARFSRDSRQSRQA